MAFSGRFPCRIIAWTWSFTAVSMSAVHFEVRLHAGAAVNVADNRGQTPLHGAAFWGRNDLV
jgi:hypothetical protein